MENSKIFEVEVSNNQKLQLEQVNSHGNKYFMVRVLGENGEYKGEIMKEEEFAMLMNYFINCKNGIEPFDYIQRK